MLYCPERCQSRLWVWTQLLSHLITSGAGRLPLPSFDCRIPAELIKVQGDWHNNAYLGRLPLVRTGRPDLSICKENSTFNQSCPARSFYFYIVCIAVMSFERKLSKEAYFIFKMTALTSQFGLLVSALSSFRNDQSTEASSCNSHG